MHHLHLWRLIAALLLAAAPLATPVLAGAAPVALADNGNNGNGDGNRGHGNDPDGVDEDNPGKSKEAKDKEKDKNAGKGKQVETIPVAGYTVAVDCDDAEETGRTACAFSAIAPEGGRDVGFVQVPAENLCAEVVETEAEFVDPDPNTHITGYKSRGSEGSLALVLDGEVTPAGTATYWIKTGDGVFPVEGPGLRCAPAGTVPTATVQFEVTPEATETPTTGTVVVDVLTCADVPADTTAFDWFGACQPGGAATRDFTLAPSDDATAAPATATTDATGEATFAEVAPGEYRLDLVDGSWCHANADRVTAESEVVVEAGAATTVWIFLCEAPSGA